MGFVKGHFEMKFTGAAETARSPPRGEAEGGLGKKKNPPSAGMQTQLGSFLELVMDSAHTVLSVSSPALLRCSSSNSWGGGVEGRHKLLILWLFSS